MFKNNKKKEKKTAEPQGFSGNVYMLAHDLLYILAAITVVFVFVIRLVGVKGSSMYPTLVGEPNDWEAASSQTKYRGDYLALLSNALNPEYRRGDVVVACVPSFDDGKPIVKRVIASGGETVDVRNDGDGTYSVWVDGIRLDEPYIREDMTGNAGTWNYPVVVPEGCYFCMGDNRNNSHDSRMGDIGMIDGRYITGKVLFVALPGQDVYENGRFDAGRFGAIHNER